MKIIIVGSDRKLFEEKSNVRMRYFDYAKFADEIHIIIFSLATVGHKPVAIADNVWLYPTNSTSRFLYIFDAIRIGRQIKKKINDNNSVVAVSQDPFESGFAAWRIAAGGPLNLQVHTDIGSPYYKRESLLNHSRLFMARFLLARGTGIRVVSQRIKDELVSRWHIPEWKIRVLPILIDTDTLAHQPSIDLHQKYPEFKNIILMASRLTPEKNIGFALQVFAKVHERQSDTGLVIVGQGSEEATLRRTAEVLGIGSHVRFEGWHDDLASYYKTADIFLLTSLYEGYGMTLVEAGYLGTAILTADVGVVGSVLRDKEEVLACDVDDKECFEGNLEQLVLEPEFRAELARTAKESLHASLVTKEQYLDAYKTMLEACFPDFSGFEKDI